MLARMRIRRQLGTFPRFQHRKDDGTDERPDKLRDGLVDIENAKVNSRKLTCGSDGAVVGGRGEEVVGAVAMLEVEGVGACELDGGGVGRG